MVVFRIMMIILVAAPVIGIAWYLYGQMLSVVRERNRAELERTKKKKAASRAAKASDRADFEGGRR